MVRLSYPIGIYVIVSGVLLGLATALLMARLINESGGEGGVAAFVAILAFIGISGTTIGIGTLVIIMGRVLAAVSRQ